MAKPHAPTSQPPASLHKRKQDPERGVPNSYIDVHWAVNPFIDLLLNLQHGFLCLLALFAIRPLMQKFPRSSELGQIIRLLVLWAVCILFTILCVLNLRPQPRYFATLTCLCGILAAIWLAGLAKQRRGVVGVAILLLVTVDLGAAWLRPDPIMAERWLVRYAATSQAPLWTTSEHADAAQLLLSERGLTDRVHGADPKVAPAGALYFVTKKDAEVDSLQAWPVEWANRRGSPSFPLINLLPPFARSVLDRLRTPFKT